MRSGRDGKKAGRKTRKRGRFRKDPKSVCTKGGRLHKAELFRKNFNQRNSGSTYLSPNYLSELFKKHTGKTISEYLTEYRLEKACQLLDHAEYRVGDVSGMVGIHDGRYFSNMFKKKYGMTPTEYRNR